MKTDMRHFATSTRTAAVLIALLFGASRSTKSSSIVSGMDFIRLPETLLRHRRNVSDEHELSVIELSSLTNLYTTDDIVVTRRLHR